MCILLQHFRSIIMITLQVSAQKTLELIHLGKKNKKALQCNKFLGLYIWEHISSASSSCPD